MIYNFYTNMTSAPIVNAISKWLPGVKLVDYKIDPNSKDKIFTLGYEGETFDFIISEEDGVSISMKVSAMINALKHFYSAFDKKALSETHSILLQSARNHKINTVFNV